MEKHKTDSRPLVIKSKSWTRIITLQNLEISVKSIAYRIGVNLRNALFFGAGALTYGITLMLLANAPLMLWLCMYFILIPFGVCIQNVITM